MRTYIWDNGDPSHQVWYIESDLPREDVETILAGMDYIGGYIIGVVDGRIEWRGGDTSTLDNWVRWVLFSHRGRSLRENTATQPSLALALCKKHGLGGSTP